MKNHISITWYPENMITVRDHSGTLSKVGKLLWQRKLKDKFSAKKIYDRLMNKLSDPVKLIAELERMK